MPQKKNEGILFSAEIRVTGFYTDCLLISKLSSISKIKLMEGECHPLQGSQNRSYPSVRLSIWLSICKALRQTKDYVIFFFFFFSIQEVHYFLLHSWKFFPNSAFSHWLLRDHMTSSNRPFYRYGGHFESIRFKGYYGMPRGTFSTIRYTHSVFRRAFRVNVFLEKDCNGKKRSTYRVWM